MRISERNVGVRPPSDLNPLAAAGVQLIVDEVGRSTLSPEWLARAPIQAFQLDRAWVVAARKDAVALKVCRANIAVAKALDLTPIATGIDAAEQRSLLAALGCVQGSGDLYLESTSEAVATLKARGIRKSPKARV